MRFRIAAFAVIFFSAVAFYSTFLYFHRQLGYGDNAFLSEMTENIAHRGLPVSQIASAIDQQFKVGFVQSPEAVCANPLPPPEVKEFNYFRWHTYFVLYLLAPFVLLFGAPFTLSFFTVLSFVGLLGAAYIFLTKKNVPAALAIPVVLLIFSHPGWSTAITGQIYVDRLFTGLGFLLIWALDRRSTSRWPLIAISILCTLLSDRFGLAVGGIVIAHTLLSKEVPWKEKWRLFAFGTFFAVFSLLLIKLYIQHPQYSGFVSSGTFTSFYKTHLFFEKMTYFVMVNFVLFGILGLMSPRYLLIAMALMIPNVFTNIGGAEKTSFLTHYHSAYFPVLAFAVVHGVSRFYEKFKDSNWRWMACPVIVIFIVLQLGLSYDAVNARTISDLRSPELKDRAIALPFNRFDDYRKPAGESTYLQHIHAIREAVPLGSRVSTPEFGMTWFENRAEIYYYPNGLDAADYLVLPVEYDANRKPFFSGVINYLGPDVVARENSCLTERIAEHFDVAAMKTFGGYAVIKRKASRD